MAETSLADFCMILDDIRRRMDLQTDKLIDRENIVIEDYYYLLTVYMKIKTFFRDFGIEEILSRMNI